MSRNTDTLRLSWIRGHQISSSTDVFPAIAARRHSKLSNLSLELPMSNRLAPFCVVVALCMVYYLSHVTCALMHAGDGKPDLTA